VQYGALRLVLTFARGVSVERLAGLGAGIMRLVGPRLRQHRRALANLAIAFPDKSEAERAAIARAMWANMGRTYAETLVLDRLLAEPGRVVLADEAHWRAAAAAAGPLVGCTLHLGNWEVAIQPLNWFGKRPVGVYKPLDNPLVDAWLADTRRALYPGGLLGKGDRDEGRAGQRTALRLIDLARKGHALGFVADHFDRRGEPVAFMGRTARFTTAPAAIARHVGARVWVGRAERIGSESRFRIVYEELAVPRTADKRADALALTVAIFRTFEDFIRAQPEQWMWWNTRWIDQGATGACEGAEPAADGGAA
jgi:KDO2-lipid IV(A) lauroyltransferase